MANTDKDLYQKEAAIRFCLLNDIIPFLEVKVNNYRELSDTSTLITDIDVLGVKIESTGLPRRTLFDCKTLKTSAINRAFWAAGVMAFTGCSESFVILKKRASEAHRLSAKKINVHLFDDGQFANYANSCSFDFSLSYCYSTDVVNWVSMAEAGNGNEKLKQFIAFLNNEIPLEQDAVKGLRRLLAAVQLIRGELDPSKPKHLSILLYCVSNFAFILAQIIHDLRNVIDFDSDAESFEKLLKYYVWGGRDSFNLRRKLTELFSAHNQSHASLETELKSWPEFIELTRKLLDSPSGIDKCIFPLRELALRANAVRSLEKDKFISDLISGNARTRQFTYFMVKYIVSAVRLPKEFINVIDSLFEDVKNI